MRADLVFVVCGLFITVPGFFANVPNGGDLAIDPDVPLSMIHGEYQIDDVSMYAYRSTWASIWEIASKDAENGFFHITVWPPKYCHAVYVCPHKKQTYSAVVNFKTDEAEICEKEYIKFYPHAKKLHIKTDATDPVEKVWVKNRLEFELGDTDNKWSIKALSDAPKTHVALMNVTAEYIPMDMTGKNLLILTNSRMCQVNKVGVGFKPLFRYGVQLQANENSYPKWLSYQNAFVATDYLTPANRGPKKTIDLLKYLQEKKWTDTSAAKANKQFVKSCRPAAGWKSGGRKTNTGGKFKKVSVNSYSFDTLNYRTNNQVVKSFSLKVENCHWFRLWFTSSEMSDYTNNLNLPDTVDFFLNEGFYIRPDTDTAVPLPGVTELTKFIFTVPHRDVHENTKLDMMYGEAQGTPIYHDQFVLKQAFEVQSKLHIIKAPECEIALDTRTSSYSHNNKKSEVFNFWKIDKCEFSYFM